MIYHEAKCLVHNGPLVCLLKSIDITTRNMTMHSTPPCVLCPLLKKKMRKVTSGIGIYSSQARKYTLAFPEWIAELGER